MTSKFTLEIYYAGMQQIDFHGFLFTTYYLLFTNQFVAAE